MILLLAPEFSWRTARQNVIDGLSKKRFYTGKIIVLAALVALFPCHSHRDCGYVGTLFSPSESSWPLVGPVRRQLRVGLRTSRLLLWGSGAFMLAALLRSSGAAMGIMFVYLLVEQLLAQLMTELSEDSGPRDRFSAGRGAQLRSRILGMHYPE